VEMNCERPSGRDSTSDIVPSIFMFFTVVVVC
jgi:hypothetical protein